MKKIIYALILALIGLYILLAVFSSGNEYAAEKLLYHAIRINTKFAANPDVVPPAMRGTVERYLSIILNKYPASKVSGVARLSLAEFYIASKKYDKASPVLDDIMARYPSDEGAQSRAQFLRGLIYEKQDKWDRALEEYNLLMTKYPKTQLGLQIPFYIARYYHGKGQQELAKAAYSNAVPFYKKLEEENRNNLAGYASANLLVYAYMYLGQYEEAGKTAVDALNTYPLPLSLRDQMQNVDIIYLNMLKRPQEAIEIFRGVREKTKDPRAQKLLDRHIADIEKQMLDKKQAN